jgi:hypothetical protein
MSMKGGAAGPKTLIVDRTDFFDPPGEAGEFSLSRAICAAMDGLPPDMLNKVIRQCEGLPGSSSETDIRNFLKKVTAEMRDEEGGLMTLLSAYPMEDDQPELDLEIAEAFVPLMAGIGVAEEHEAALAKEEPVSSMASYKELLDHLVPALYHFKKADDLYRGPDQTRPSLLPSFMTDISPDAVRQIQKELDLRPAVEIDVTKIINAALETGVVGLPGKTEASVLRFPPFKSLFENPKKPEDTLAAFEEMLQKFKEGAVSVYEVRDLAAGIEDPGLQQMCTEIVRKVEEEKLMGRPVAEMKATLDFADLQRVPNVAFALQKLEKDLSRQSAELMENLQTLEENPGMAFAAPALEDTQDMVRQTARIRNALEDFKDAPSPEKYRELADMTQVLEDMGREAAPDLQAFNAEAEKIAFEHNQALEAQQAQIAFQMEQLAPKSPEVSGPALFGGGDGGGMIG